MAFNALYFLKNYADEDSGNDYLVRTIQAADADAMARLYAAELADLVALNAEIEDDDRKYTPVDAMLSAAGDGHTFLYTVTLARTMLAAPQQLLLGQQVIPVTAGPPAYLKAFVELPISPSITDNPTLDQGNSAVPIPPFFLTPELFITKFGVASTGEEVQAVHNRLIDELAAEIVARAAAAEILVHNGFFSPFQGIAGGAKGQRFMVAISGAPVLRSED